MLLPADSSEPTAPHNAFLRRLDPETLRLLRPHLTLLDLRLGETLVHAEDPIEWVYFPETALLSVLVHSLHGDSVETAMSGAEGALLLGEACGSGVSYASAHVQSSGQAWRASAAFVRSLAADNHDFAANVFRLLELQLLESRQSGLCQALHPVEDRLARWMLESSERSGGRPVIQLTQEYIAAMLGVQRTTVTAFASQLQKAGLIRYSRGKIELIDPEGLEKRACECRRAALEHRSRLELRAPMVSRPHLSLVS